MKHRTRLMALAMLSLVLFSLGCAIESKEPSGGTVAVPTFNPAAGIYPTAQDVTITTTTTNASIRYTTDGTDPTSTSGTIYGGPVHIAASLTLKAVAYLADGTTSLMIAGEYTISTVVPAPVFSPGPGTYSSARDVAIVTSLAEASIRYTTDGSTPSETVGTLYIGPVHIASTTTLKAVAYRAGWTTSPVTTGLYTITPQVAAPAFNPVPGTYPDPQDVVISTSTPSAIIRYTTDGSTPTETNGTVYAGPVHVAETLTLKAVAYRTGWKTSSVTSGDYRIGLFVAAPEFNPGPGSYPAAQDIIITTTTAGATIRYTIDGSTPTETHGTVYTAPVHLTQSVRLRAVAYRTGWTTSEVTSGLYAIGLTVMAPEFSVTPGIYATAVDVVIATATAGATIRFTTDGSTPTESAGTLYTAPVHIAESLTLKAIAYRDGWTTSSVTVGEYKRVGIAAGMFHTILARSDGTVWTWGGNAQGQIGDGTETSAPTPVQVEGIAGVVAVAAGYNHSVALNNEGTVWAWGRNWYGQLGDGTTTQRLAPVETQGISGVTAIAGGQDSTYALKNDGTVWAWGHNNLGQLGDGTTTDRLSPVQVGTLSGIVAIAAGASHGAALKSDGTIWTWGYNVYGSLGDGTTNTRLTPVRVTGLSGMTGIAANGYHTAAVKSDGTLWSWGTGSHGELGSGAMPLSRLTPVEALDLTSVAAAGAGSSHTIALIDGGALRACGYNYYGQLGDGTSTDRSIAVPVVGISAAVTAAGGFYHTVAIVDDETVWAWGRNYDYQLGDGTTTDRWTPVQVIW